MMKTKINPISIVSLTLLISFILFITTRNSCDNPDSNISTHFTEAISDKHNTNISSQLIEAISNKPDKDDLDIVLEETAMANKTLIIAVVNKAYVQGSRPMIRIFLDSFWSGEDTRSLVDHLLVAAMDDTSYARCKFLRLHCFKLETEGVDFSKEKVYMTEDFIKMMWKRTKFLGDVLKKGYSFIFTDMDVLWLRNPFTKLTSNATYDLEISTDEFNGEETSNLNPINTGFYKVRSNNKTIELFDSWYSHKEHSKGKKEQDVLREIIDDGGYETMGLKIRFLDTRHFSGFCEVSKDADDVTTFHANCCKTMRAKLADLTELSRAWQRYRHNKTASILRPSYHPLCLGVGRT